MRECNTDSTLGKWPEKYIEVTMTVIIDWLARSGYDEQLHCHDRRCLADKIIGIWQISRRAANCRNKTIRSAWRTWKRHFRTIWERLLQYLSLWRLQGEQVSVNQKAMILGRPFLLTSFMLSVTAVGGLVCSLPTSATAGLLRERKNSFDDGRNAAFKTLVEDSSAW